MLHKPWQGINTLVTVFVKNDVQNHTARVAQETPHNRVWRIIWDLCYSQVCSRVNAQARSELHQYSFWEEPHAER